MIRLALAFALALGGSLTGCTLRTAYLDDVTDHAAAARRADEAFCNHDWHDRAPVECGPESSGQ